MKKAFEPQIHEDNRPVADNAPKIFQGQIFLPVRISSLPTRCENIRPQDMKLFPLIKAFGFL